MDWWDKKIVSTFALMLYLNLENEIQQNNGTEMHKPNFTVYFFIVFFLNSKQTREALEDGIK